MPLIDASLRCFKRPVVWAAIGLLLLNDHYLKGTYPSWWTGKLSDVAGLFFFPFMARRMLYIPCSHKIDLGPYDLSISTTGNSYRVFAAFGNEGVVMRNPDGSWERQQSLYAWPTSFRATDLLDVIITTPIELAAFTLFVFIFGAGQFTVFLRRTEFLKLPVLALLAADCYLASTTYFEIDFICAIIIGNVIIILILYAIHRTIGDKLKIVSRVQSNQAFKIWLSSTIGLFILGITLISFWAFGIIPFYWLMMFLLVGSAVSITIWTVRRNQQLLAESQETSTSLDGS